MPRKRKNMGAGGYFRGEKWVPFTWGKKISAGLLAVPMVESKCVQCGQSFSVRRGREGIRKWCSHKCRYGVQYTNEEPIAKKAIIWGANIRMGRGKKAFLMGLIRDALGKFCRYCHEVLHIDNISIDHREPFQGTRGDALAHKVLDRPENLEVVCRACNRRKGNFSDSEYERLLSFLGDPLNIALRKKLFKRLGHTSMLAGRGWGR